MKPSSTKGPSTTTMYSNLRPTAMQLRQERGGPRQAMHPRKASLPLACRAVTTRFAKDISLTSTEEATRPQQRNAPFIAIDGSSSSQYVDAQNVYARLCQPAAQAGRMSTAAYPHHVPSSTRPASSSQPDAAGSPRAAAPTAAPHSQAADSFPEDVSCMAAIDESFFMYNDLAGQPDLPRPPRYRSPLMSVVSAALISPLYPDNHASDTSMLNKSSSTSILARSQLGQQAAVQVMRDITTQQDNILSQASRAVASATRLAQTIPTAGAAAVKAAADAAAASLTSPAGPLGLKAVVAGVTEQWSDDLARLQQAAVALQSRGSTLQDLEAKVAALQAERDSLSVQLQETNRRAQFAESVAAGMTARLDDKRALSTLDDAMQVFRRHIASVPADLAPSMFIEQPDDIIGKGGCATVYKWRVGATDWAVKSDPISHRNQSAQEFDPQRCGDLLPAFLPPHANIMAPRAWWVGPLAPPAPMPQQQHTSTHARPLTAASGFKLYTLYEKYSCSLWDHMQLLHSIKFPQEQQQQESDFTARGKEAKSGVCSPAGLPGSSDALLLDLRSLLTIVRDVAAALEHLARHRVVHGDVKMENVLLVLHPDTAAAAAQPKRVARAVLIDFGLCAMMPQGVEKLKTRGGTWLFKAPEQMSGPPGMCLGGQERSANPHVELQTDVWALGALIAMLCNNGVLPSKPGLPFGVPPEQLLKWGDRPKGGSMEPFYMTWDEVLPKLPGSMGAINAEPMPMGCAVTESAAAVQYAHVMALLRRLAQGCMQVQPSQRLSAGQVRAAAAEALSQLC